MVAPSVPKAPAVLAVALDYAAKGWRALPLPIKHDGHKADGKAPAFQRWQQDASSDPKLLAEWWSRWPTANVGLLCDPSFGFAVDIDDLEVLTFLPDFPKTLTAWTPGGGCHFVYRHPVVELGNDVTGVRAIAKAAGWKPRVDAEGKSRGIDIRGKAGQIVVWPSISPRLQKHWRWDDFAVPIAPAPEWLIAALQSQPAPRAEPPMVASWGQSDPYVERAIVEVTRELAGVGKGQRGGRLYHAAARLGELGVSHAEAERALMGACDANGLVKQDGEASVLRELRRGWDQGAANPVERPAPSPMREPAMTATGTWTPPERPPLEPEPEGPRDELGDLIKPNARAGSVRWAKLTEKGDPISCRENVEALLKHYGVRARYNLMTGEDEYEVRGYGGAADKRANTGVAQVREWACLHGLSLSRLDDQLCLIVADDSYHPVAEWIGSKPWDGVDRLGDLFGTLTLAYDDEARRGLMLRLFTAWCATAARAALVPATTRIGVAAQLVLVLQGPQGVQKTRWVQALVPTSREWAREGVMLDPSSRDSVQQATNVWIVELGELDATFRKSDIAALKAHLTSRTDTYRAAYARKSETRARRTVYAATVNERGMLHDDTGSRRFAVVSVSACDAAHGLDTQQFWAQMATLPESSCFLAPDDERALIDSNREHEATDPLADLCATYWEVDDGPLPRWETLKSVLSQIDSQRQWTASDSRAIAKVMRNKWSARTRDVKGTTQFAVRSRGLL